MNATMAVVAKPGAVFVHQLAFDPGSRDDVEPATLTIELNATDAQEARVFGQELFSKAQSLAGGSPGFRSWRAHGDDFAVISPAFPGFSGSWLPESV